MKLLAAATILGSIVSVQMYSKGAPATVCTSMIPKHGASPQSNASPYTLTVSKQSYKPKEVIQGNKIFLSQILTTNPETEAAIQSKLITRIIC